MTTSNRAGHRSLSELPELSSYSTQELKQSGWPAIDRYLQLIQQNASDFSAQLRLKRHRDWLKCALAIRYARARAEDVCRWWSRRADELLREAWQKSGCEAAGFSLIAMGKLGSDELNLSSDVDLIFLRRDDETYNTKPAREFQKILTEINDFGFVFRVDLNLRPGGSGSTLLPSRAEFEHHYGSYGETWERLAQVRMRPLTGPHEVIESIEQFSRKFVYRRHLDYTVLDDLKLLRFKLRAEKFEKRTGEYHLKLGAGGIRDLELFVHALQVIHAGRRPHLRSRSTATALLALAEEGLLPKDEAEFLAESYWYLRDLENHLHAFEDQQTYVVDLVAGHPALPSDFAAKLQATTRRVAAITETILGPSQESLNDLSQPNPTAEWLTGLGFSGERAMGLWQDLLDATALSRKTERDEIARLNFLRQFVLRLAQVGVDRELGLTLFLEFVKAIRAKASLFTLFNREEKLIEQLAKLFSVSPYLGSILSQRPELIDAFILRQQAKLSDDDDLALDELAERRLLAELISANVFIDDFDLSKLQSNLTDNADEISLELLRRLNKQHAPASVELLAMGKWGSRELGFRSDLDFIFLTPAEPTANDLRVAKRFLSRISEPHRGGAIYAVDMRLRPSGSAGPILVSHQHLRNYLEREAAPWERQAYLRSRSFSELQFRPAAIAAERGLNELDCEELRQIRDKLFAVDSADELDLKLSFGGLADIEFAAQIALLARREFALDPSTFGMIEYLKDVDAQWKEVGELLQKNYGELRRIEQLFHLTVSSSGSRLRTKSNEFMRLAKVVKLNANDLESLIRQLFAANRAALRELRTVTSRF